jgi:hypothetical protein
MKKTLALPTTSTTSVPLDLRAESFEDASVVVCVVVSPIMDGPGVVAGELARFERSARPRGQRLYRYWDRGQRRSWRDPSHGRRLLELAETVGAVTRVNGQATETLAQFDPVS